MSQVIMLFLFPIGLYFYIFVERKNRPEYEKVFDDFQKRISQNTRLSNENKLLRFKTMLSNNDYRITFEDKVNIKAEKKIFSISLLMMSLGIFFIGVVMYLVYFYFFQKAHQVHYYL
jgi:hypothetical protein